MSLYVSETGTLGAPSIMFLHGVGTSGWMWEKQTAALDDFHCLNVDLPGHGKSHHLAWVSLADTADQLGAIIQTRATNGRAHLVGLSLGGYLALVLLERHANVVDHVVISGVTAAPWPNRMFLKAQIWLFTTLMKRRRLVSLQARALRLSPDSQADFSENLLAMSADTYRLIAQEAAAYQVPDLLQFVSVPTLITAGGRESKIITQSVEMIPRLMPNAQGRIAPGLGHGWNVQAPELFNAMVRAWITNAPLPAALQMAPSTDSRRGEAP
jgi:pimeloyl-ACP methyl ester carboxylesterase